MRLGDLKLNKARILIVDDLPSARKILRRLLEAIGFSDITEAVSGEAALKQIEQAQFSLIISDWQMPQMNGLELLQHLRQQPSKANIPFLFITSANSKTDVQAAFEGGVRDYLTKPFTAQLLETKVLELLKAKDATSH